jgi:hypothetical protein
MIKGEKKRQEKEGPKGEKGEDKRRKIKKEKKKEIKRAITSEDLNRDINKSAISRNATCSIWEHVAGN